MSIKDSGKPSNDSSRKDTSIRGLLSRRQPFLLKRRAHAMATVLHYFVDYLFFFFFFFFF
jgi:hypothetical protein